MIPASTEPSCLGQSPWTLNWAAQYDHEFDVDTKAFVRINGTDRGPFFDYLGDLPISTQLRADEVDIWNLRAGVTTGSLSIAANAENLFNSRGIAGVRNPGGFKPGGWTMRW